MTATATEVPMFKIIAVDSIRVSPQNPRKKKRNIEQLAESIKRSGVLEPLLVRPIGETKFEIVAGERRWTSSKLAGLEEVPCMVREISAEHALELALVENVERDDLLPTEEANAFELLMKAYKRTVEDVASKVGRSIEYVRQRLRLTKLIAPLAKLLDDELLDMGAALVCAQFPEATQTKIEQAFYGEHSTARGWVRKKKGERVTRGDVLDAIAAFTHLLNDAPFLTTDPNLLPKAGACTTCPMRTGRQGDLYEVTEQTDTCLNDACWADKSRAQFDARAADHKKRGLPVLSDAEAKKILRHGRLDYAAQQKYALADEEKYIGDKRKTVAAIIGDETPRALAFDESTCRTVELVERKVVDAAMAQITKDAEARARSKKKNAGATKEEERAARERDGHKRKKAVNEHLRIVACAAVVGQVTSGRTSVEKALRVLVAARVSESNAKAIVKRRHLEVPADDKKAERDPHSIAVMNAAAVMKTPKELVALLCELLAADSVSPSPWANDETTPGELVGLGVDLKKLRKIAEQELRDAAKKKATAAAKKPAAKPAPTAKAVTKKAA